MHLVPQATFPSARIASSCRTKLCQVPRLGRGGRKNTWSWFINCKTTTRCCCVIPEVELRLVLRKWNKTGWVNLMCPKLGVSSEISCESAALQCGDWLQQIPSLLQCCMTPTHHPHDGVCSNFWCILMNNKAFDVVLAFSSQKINSNKQFTNIFANTILQTIQIWVKEILNANNGYRG